MGLGLLLAAGVVVGAYRALPPEPAHGPAGAAPPPASGSRAGPLAEGPGASGEQPTPEENARAQALTEVHPLPLRDAQAAARDIARAPPGPAREAAALALALQWSERDLAGAVEWIATLPEKALRDRALQSVACEVANRDPLTAIGLGDRLDTRERVPLLLHASLQWASVEPVEAMDWAMTLDDPLVRDQAMAHVTTAWGETDPATAATMALLFITPGRQQNNAVIGIVQRWVQQAPDAVAQWVEQFPPGALHRTAVDNVVALWREQSPERLAVWMEGLAEGATRDAAFACLATLPPPRLP